MNSTTTMLDFNNNSVDIGYGQVAHFLTETLVGARNHYYKPAIRESQEQRFTSLRLLWEENTRFSSSISEITSNTAYLRIIGMGEKALPYIFRSMKYAPNHWFWALQSIVLIDPVKKEHRGNVKAMTIDWLEWAEKHGYKVL